MSRHASRMIVVAAGVLGTLALGSSAGAQAPDQGDRPARGARHGEMRRGPVDPAQRIDRQVAMLSQRLQLDDDQQARIRRILTEEDQQVQALFARAGIQRPQGPRPDSARGDGERQRGARTAPDSTARADMRQRMEALRPEMDTIRTRTAQRIEAVLTAQQATTYRELRESMRSERGHRGPGGRGALRPAGGAR